jgi:Bacterial mobilisation protein (MobC)
MTDAPEPSPAETPATDAGPVIHLPDLSVGPERAAVRRRVTDPRTAWLPATRVTPELRDRVDAEAAAAGLSLGAFMRAKLDGTPGPRAKRNPGPETVLLAQLLGQCGKVGSNLNQIAYRLNSDGELDFPELEDAIAEIRSVSAAIMRALGT